MSRLLVQMQTSADGHVEAADPALQWQLWDWGPNWPWDEELKRDFNQTFRKVDRILLSRKMVEEGYIDHWARIAASHPDEPDFAFARKVGDAEKIVFSTTHQRGRLRWPRTRWAAGGLAETIAHLKAGPGADLIAFGGTGFAAALAAAGVVDEYQLYVNPTAVGRGESLFRSVAGGLRLRLVRSTSYACGIVVNTYTPHADGDRPSRPGTGRPVNEGP
ncbi:dihydrofolate reductase family protein [[Actinomadura] parvosata]|uniref:Dihydrofolate reductase family protein n=1 Tax=Nonomuraea composti TaxID=2720023 RepID=A0ABX1AZF1_9ACTN|nr:dihydrofolate reductase family protein [Nonomuraea sp. FMUSA5-5]NJP90985.1 dihydrofolate reductase family protein [Nonomuraea sp. FMUSA5-5]